MLGFAYWIAAARFYSPAVVGESAALISALLLLASIAELNLYNTLIRFLPTAGSRSGSYVLRAYLAVIGAGLVVGVVARPLLDSLTLLDQLLDVGWRPRMFLGAVILFTLFALQDGVAIGLRAAVGYRSRTGVVRRGETAAPGRVRRLGQPRDHHLVAA